MVADDDETQPWMAAKLQNNQLKSTHQVFGRAQSLQPIQGQKVSGVLVRELGGLLQAPLLVQDGFIPDG